MRIAGLVMLSLIGCAKQQGQLDIQGAWHLDAQVTPTGEEVPFADDAEINVINWNLSGFAFKRGGTVFGLTTRKDYDFEINRGQRAKYRLSDEGDVLMLKDDIFGQTFGNIRQDLTILRLTADNLEVEDEGGSQYRFVRP